MFTRLYKVSCDAIQTWSSTFNVDIMLELGNPYYPGINIEVRCSTAATGNKESRGLHLGKDVNIFLTRRGHTETIVLQFAFSAFGTVSSAAEIIPLCTLALMCSAKSPGPRFVQWKSCPVDLAGCFLLRSMWHEPVFNVRISWCRKHKRLA